MPDEERPAMSVIVPARDAAGTLPRTLDGLAGQTFRRRFEVIVVDNGSRDGTPEIAEGHPLAPRVIRRPRGEGPGAARNDGVAASRGEVLAFVDADCTPTPTWLAEGFAAIADRDLVAGAVRPAPDDAVDLFDRTLWVVSEHGLYETANLFVRRAWFERLGGFHDWAHDRADRSSSARPFGEDVWFAWSARRLGARTGFAPGAVVHHAVFPGTARDYVVERWRLRFFPALVRRVPELRRTFAWNRVFLNRRTAMFDAALAGGIAALAIWSLLPLPALAPYAVALTRDAVRWGPKRAVAIVARDVVAFAALVTGSAQARTVLV